MRHKIKEWISNPDRSFQSGLDLFNKTKHSNEFDNFFSNNVSAARSSLPFKMLDKHLQNILRIIEQNLENEPEPVKENPLIKTKPIGTPTLNIKASQKQSVKILTEIELKNLPEDLQKKYARLKLIVPLMNANQQEMRGAGTDERRKELADHICELEEEKDGYWSEIDAFAAEPKSQAETPDPVAIALAKRTRIDNLKIYISREAKKLSNPKSIKKIEGWKNELTELEK